MENQENSQIRDSYIVSKRRIQKELLATRLIRARSIYNQNIVTYFDSQDLEQ
jgi:hypothetical protein